MGCVAVIGMGDVYDEVPTFCRDDDDAGGRRRWLQHQRARAEADDVATANRYAATAATKFMARHGVGHAGRPAALDDPLITVTPRLEQEFRMDFYDQRNASPTTSSQGNGFNLYNYGGPGGIRAELIPSYNTELIVAFPPYVNSYSPTGANVSGMGDWPAFLVKYRIAAENEENGNYIVTAFFQVTDELGTPGKISTNVTTAQPTLAFGKGWGDFDIQMTVSELFPIGAASPESQNMRNFGNPIQVNTTFQYHLWQYFWPEFEVNYEYWPNGEHANLNQVLLTPGIIFGRFQIGNSSPTRPINLIMGAGYQFAVTGNPVIQNNIVGTVRVTF
jgi:hypothetical protein